MSKKSLYVPTTTMKETDRQNKKRDIGEENRKRKNDTMYHCKLCGIVYKNATYIYNQYRQGCKEEYYPRGVMPTYGLEKKDCLKCK